jgi:hypothetical protein
VCVCSGGPPKGNGRMAVLRVLTTVGVVVVAVGLIATVVYQSSNLTSQPSVAGVFHDSTDPQASQIVASPPDSVDLQASSDGTFACGTMAVFFVFGFSIFCKDSCVECHAYLKFVATLWLQTAYGVG